jgi:hypothetical protein
MSGRLLRSLVHDVLRAQCSDRHCQKDAIQLFCMQFALGNLSGRTLQCSGQPEVSKLGKTAMIDLYFSRLCQPCLKPLDYRKREQTLSSNCPIHCSGPQSDQVQVYVATSHCNFKEYVATSEFRSSLSPFLVISNQCCPICLYGYGKTLLFLPQCRVKNQCFGQMH